MASCEKVLLKVKDFVNQTNSRETMEMLKKNPKKQQDGMEIIQAEMALQNYECIANNALNIQLLSKIVFKYDNKCYLANISIDGVAVENNDVLSTDYRTVTFLDISPMECT